MAFIYLITGFVVLLLSGNFLVKGSVQLARYFKISTLVIGLTVVAFGTSAPELFVSLKAAFAGVPDIAVGNVVGSNIANIALILGLVAIVYPIEIKNKTVWFDWLVMFVVSLLLLLFGYNGYISLIEGLLFFMGLVVYVLWSFFHSRNPGAREMEKSPGPEMGLLAALAMVLASIVGLYYGAEWLVYGARELAVSWGVSDRVIGISIVAFGTSVPELATSLVASFRKEADISVGNIVGSNIFNILAVLGLTAIIKPLPVNNPGMFALDMVWAIGLTIVLLLFILPLSKGKITQWKGALLFLIYLSYIYFLFR